MAKPQLFWIILILLITCFMPCGFFIWYESVDPAFIPNANYNFILRWVLPSLTVLTIGYLLSQYKNFAQVKESLDEHFIAEGRLVKYFTLLFSPVFIYFYFWTFINIPIQLWANYQLAEYWSQEYLLVEATTCSSDYEPHCVELKFSDLASEETHSIRWYLDKAELLTLKNKRVNLVGEKSYFGYIINTIQW
ncbi:MULTISPECIES: hypothetical protein [unclassified Pseudoalteromonas]|uniref:hypothetical protein n=1 Tax=unclassified Pseudoalteromonas TaxID=194690 RepID=UPI0015FF39A7|nr:MULTISPECIES: hypothetical protein [unclassified Pseudoalteromonas]MBB1334624.1 hypothetical protein [Pseudoalteromonas sp. SR41-6]MBB1458429.1 hypothetical protein [Pseudoalteromonas sp. SG41-8]